MSNAGNTQDIGVRLSLQGQTQFNRGMDESASKVDNLGRKTEDAGKKSKAAGVTIGQAFSPLGRVFSNTLLATTPLGMALDNLLQSAGNVTSQLENIDKSKAGSHLQRIGTFGAVGGAGIVAAGTALDQLSSPIEASKHQLETAITDTGGNFDDFSKQISAADKHMENFGDREGQTNQALATLTNGLRDPQLALKYLGETADIAAARHESLANAADTVVQVHAGMNRVLRQFGITATSSTKTATQLATAHKDVTNTATRLADAQRRLSDLQLEDSSKTHLSISAQVSLRNAHDAVTKAQQAHGAAVQKLDTTQQVANAGTGTFAANMALVAQRTHGQAGAAVDSFGGKLDILKAKILDTAGEFGQKYGPAIMGTGAIITGLGSITTAAGSVISHFSQAAADATKATEATTAATEGLTTATEAQMTLFDADTLSTDALSASLDVAAGSEAAAAGGFDLMAVAAAVFDAIPIILLIVGIVAALVLLGYGIYKLVTNWKQYWGDIKRWTKDGFDAVKNVVMEGLHWLEKNWPLIAQILISIFLPGGIIIAAIWHWHDDVMHVVNSVLDFFTGLPGRIAGVAVHMWDGLTGSFKGAINWIIGLWDDLSGHSTVHIPKVHVWGIGDIGGGSIGPLVPNIPRLHAGGTTVTSGTALIRPNEEMVHLPGGATVVPLSGSAGMDAGPYGPIGPVTLQVVLDRKVLAKAVYDDLRDQAARR